MARLFNHPLSLTLVLAFAGAAGVVLAPKGRPAGARWVALLTSVLLLLAISSLWFTYDPDGKTWQFAERYGVGGSSGVSLYFGVDGTSILLLSLTTAMAIVAVLASWDSIATRVREFYALLLLAEAAMIGVFVALDLLVFFISSQIALASLYLLTVGWGSRSHAPRLALGWIVIGVLMAAGMLALYFAEPGGAAHSSDITLLHTRAASPALQSSVFLLFLLAFGATMGVFPLHRWTVAAVTAAPTPVAVFVAALLTKLGAYGIFRLLLPLAPDACRRVAPLVAWIALAGMIALALVAWRQRDLRRMIAYANASQMSVMLLGLFALTPAGIGISLTQQIGHAFWITGWLVCASVLSERTGDSGVLAVGGLHKRTPILAGLFAIVVAAATGVFGFLGFIDEASGLRGSQGGQRWGLVAVTGLFVSLLYVIPLVRRMFATAPAPALTLDPRLSGRQLAMLVPVAAFAVIAGVYPDPVLRRVETSVGRVVARIHPEMTPYLRLGADCPTAAPPDPAGPPPGFILVQPCAEGEPAAPKL